MSKLPTLYSDDSVYIMHAMQQWICDSASGTGSASKFLSLMNHHHDMLQSDISDM